MNGILYARYSPRPKDGESIQRQMHDLHDWCDRAGVEVQLCAYDPDVSGTVSLWNRPGLAAAIGALQPGWLLVVRNLNRIARSAGVALAIEDEVWTVRRAGLASIEDGGILDNTPHARFTRLVLYGVSELQRIEGNQRTSRRMRQGIVNGRKLSSQPPYGFRFQGDRLVRDEDEQEMLQRVSEFRDQGLGYRKVAYRLNRLGFRMRSGQSWTHVAVGRLVRSLTASCPSQQPS